MRKGARIGCGVVAAVLFTAGGIGAYNIMHGLLGGDGSTVPAADDPTAVSDSPPTTPDALAFARAFLGSWAAGPAHYEGAAGDTDDPSDAGSALHGYHDGLKLTSLAFSGIVSGGVDPSQPQARLVRYTVTAKVAGGTWSYPGRLDVVQSGGGQKAVHWASSVLYPGLSDGQTLSAGPLATSSNARVVASDGHTPLASDRFPSLTGIAATIAQHPGDQPRQAGGSGISVLDDSGAPVSTVKTFKAPPADDIVTTIDAAVQAAAEEAVRDAHTGNLPTSVVVLDWHTGHILAIAYRGPDDDAINAYKAPGSTMKIITAAALFDTAHLTPDSLAPCEPAQLAEGQTFTNEEGVPVRPDGTIEQAFTVSCNTAFIKDGTDDLIHHTDATALHAEAVNVFGWGSWSIGGGVATTDPSVPADPQGSDKAAQFIGQGQVTSTPLVMASVAATVRDGAFHQPVIMPGQRTAPAPQPMSQRTAGYLQEMMNATAQTPGGTAAPRLAGLPGVGAKTGTAEEASHTNGWMTAYNDRYAVASLVEGGSSGVDSAGWIVRDIFTGTR